MADEPSILDTLDSIAPLRSFDAFPKVPSSYRSRTSGGGIVTVVVGLLCTLLVLNDLSEYLWGSMVYRFVVDNDVGRDLKLNVDITVAMPCHCAHTDLGC